MDAKNGLINTDTLDVKHIPFAVIPAKPKARAGIHFSDCTMDPGSRVARPG
jgi:hypothetical protein